MAKSFGGALLAGVPIVMQYSHNVDCPEKNRPTEIWLREGDEKRALDLLDKMGIVKKVIMPDKPANAKG